MRWNSRQGRLPLQRQSQREALWSIAAQAVFAGLRDFSYRLAHVTSVLFAGAGALGILGTIGFVARNAMLEMGVLFSGILFVPSLIGTAVLLYQFSTDTLRIDE